MFEKIPDPKTSRDIERIAGSEAWTSDISDFKLSVLPPEGLASDEPTPLLVSALDMRGEILGRLRGRTAAVFLDYDGTLTPIVARPEDALLSDKMRETVRKLSRQCTVAIVSGRGLDDVREKVGIESLFYAGSHGFEIGGPDGWHEEYEPALEFLPDLDQAETELRERCADFRGVQVERKKFSVALHYRALEGKDPEEVATVFHAVADHCPRLSRSEGKKIFELRPDIEWHKGKALLRLLDVFDLSRPDVLIFYFGDDTTDEDAFQAIKGRGIGVLVTEEPKPTAARYTLRDPSEVQKFLEILSARLAEAGA